MKTHILFILDASGSMGERKEATISGFNEYLNGIKQDTNLKNAHFTLVTFNTQFKDVYLDETLEQVVPLDSTTYQVGGMTALYDAIAHVLVTTQDSVKKKHRALVVILTDGEENSSKEHSRADVLDMIKSFEAKGNYTFVFLGCDQDVWAEGNKIGMQQGNVKAYDPKDIQAAYRSLSKGTHGYAGGQSASVGNFWDDSNA